ncbi:MAG: CPBP family intramembrane metalloprotease [Ignavibacteriales bacterium]|nr:MAG: CPBP family intramembrane metalloprotease [Ignavibacteriales bacterium]
MKKTLFFLLVSITYSQFLYADASKEVSHPFTISLPENWIEIPRDSISESDIKNSPGETFDFLCKLRSSPGMFEPPFILIKINHSEHFFDKPLKEYSDKTFPKVDFNILANNDNKFCFEESSGWLWQKSLLMGYARINILVPGKIVILNVSCFTSETEYENHLTEVNKIVKSIKVVESKQVIYNLLGNDNLKNTNCTRAVLYFYYLIIGLPFIAVLLLIIYKKQYKLLLRLLNVLVLVAVINFLSVLIPTLIFKNQYLLFLISSQILSLIFSFVLIYFFSKGNLSGYGFNKLPPSKVVMPLIYSIVFTFLVGSLVTYVFKFFRIELVSSISPSVNKNFLWFTALFAGVVEEVEFRGLLQSYLSPLKIFSIKVKNISVSVPVIISATLFSLLHFNLGGPSLYTGFSIKVALGALATGFFLAYYREKFDSIIPCIIIHMTINFIYILLASI